MSNWIHAIILGLIEGLTEFIPVSSTGMLLLSKLAMKLTDPFWDTFCVLIQLGAIMAVVAIYFRRLWSIMLLIPTVPRARGFVLSILVAFIPAAIAGLLLHDTIKQVLFESPKLICLSLIVGRHGDPPADSLRRRPVPVSGAGAGRLALRRDHRRLDADGR
jgi:undecaprenyl-diphosphatase